MARNDIKCDFGSGARLSIGKNSAHAVIAIDENGKRLVIALTPRSMEALAEQLNALARQLRQENASDA